VGGHVRGGGAAGIPGAGQAQGGHPAGGQQHAQRRRELSGVRAAGRGVPQAGQAGRVDHVQVDVHVQRPAGHAGRGQAGGLATADLRAVQVSDLGRVQVARSGQHDPVLGHGAQAQPGGDQLGPVSGQQPQRHAAQVPGGGRLRGLHVAVGVEPDDGRIGARGLQPGDDPQRDGAVPGEHHRAAAAPDVRGHRAGHRRVQHGQRLPAAACGQGGRDHLGGLDREVQAGQVLVEVVRDADHGHGYSLGSTGSDSRARTAKTHSWTRHSGSPPATRSRASRPRAYSRSASERLWDRPRRRSRARWAGSV